MKAIGRSTRPTSRRPCLAMKIRHLHHVASWHTSSHHTLLDAFTIFDPEVGVIKEWVIKDCFGHHDQGVSIQRMSPAAPKMCQKTPSCQRAEELHAELHVERQQLTAAHDNCHVEHQQMLCSFLVGRWKIRTYSQE